MPNLITIQQAAQVTGLSTYALRYYEQEGLVLPVQRAANGHRRYSETDIASIKFVSRLRDAGMPIADIKRYVDLSQQGETTIGERLILLESHRSAVQNHIQQMNEVLAYIEAKIDHYREIHQAQLAGQWPAET